MEAPLNYEILIDVCLCDKPVFGLWDQQQL